MKTTVLGLDGADWKILNSLLEQGELPMLQKLMENGSHGVLNSTVPPNSPPAWASMITGVNPGKHNIFDFTCIDTSYDKVPIDAMSRISALPLWRIMNRFKMTTGIVNLPIHFPPEPVDGFMICGLVTPWSAEIYTHPPEISPKIGNPGEQWLIGKTLVNGGSPEAFLEEIKQKTRIQADWIIRLQNEYQPDFLFAVFDGTDKIQHFFWKYWDKTHPRHPKRTSKILMESISAYYRYIDSCLAEIIATRPESNFFIVSDHGFTGLSKDVYIENWLRQKGYLHLKETPVTSAETRYERMGHSLWNKLAASQGLKTALKNNPISRSLIFTFKERLNEKRKKARLNQNVDWSQTRVFFAGVSSQSLQVNLKGRESLGCVEVDQYNELVREVLSQVRGIIDPETGKPVLQAAYEKSEIYHGPWSQNSPDLVLIPENGYSLQEGFPDELVTPSFLYGMDRSGGHRPEGIFIACGPNIRRNPSMMNAQITDITPTVLYLNKLPIPDYVDGSVLTDLVDETYLASNPLEITDQITLSQSKSVEMTPEEKELLENHLRALGYF